MGSILLFQVDSYVQYIHMQGKVIHRTKEIHSPKRPLLPPAYTRAERHITKVYNNEKDITPTRRKPYEHGDTGPCRTQTKPNAEATRQMPMK